MKYCQLCGEPSDDERHWTLILMPGGHRFIEALCVCVPDPPMPSAWKGPVTAPPAPGSKCPACEEQRRGYGDVGVAKVKATHHALQAELVAALKECLPFVHGGGYEDPKKKAEHQAGNRARDLLRRLGEV